VSEGRVIMKKKEKGRQGFFYRDEDKVSCTALEDT